MRWSRFGFGYLDGTMEGGRRSRGQRRDAMRGEQGDAKRAPRPWELAPSDGRGGRIGG